jgi:hypothetical protein
MSKSYDNMTLYLGLGALGALIIGVVWCFTSGPCSGNTSAGSGASGSGIGAGIANTVLGGLSEINDAANSAINTMAQTIPGSDENLSDLDNGLIFGGGA